MTRVSSFGGLFHFTPENKPEGAAERCVECPLVESCAYSAPKIYERFLGDPVGERWPLRAVSSDVSREGVMAALETGPYGRCVYGGYNDVADHQVVNLEYESGATVAFTVAAFTELDFRKTRIFCTRGRMEGNGRQLSVLDFVTGTEDTVDTETTAGASAADGHGGADTDLVAAFLDSITEGRGAGVTSGPRVSLESHAVVWAAERARKTGSVITISPEPRRGSVTA